MHTQFTEESNMATALTPQTDVTSGKAYRKENRLKTQLNIYLFIFYFIKSETSDSFVNHFDGHFAYLKTLDFKALFWTNLTSHCHLCLAFNMTHLQVIKNDVSNMETMHIFNHACKPIIFYFI